MSELPDYINCKSKTIAHCDYYMHNSCQETCAYAKDIRGLGVGACCDGGLLMRMKNDQRNKDRHN